MPLSPRSSSSSRRTAGASGFLLLSQFGVVEHGLAIEARLILRISVVGTGCPFSKVRSGDLISLLFRRHRLWFGFALKQGSFPTGGSRGALIGEKRDEKTTTCDECSCRSCESYGRKLVTA
jgi:hypothetical protein